MWPLYSIAETIINCLPPPLATDFSALVLTILLAVKTGDPAILDGGIVLVTNPCVWGRVNTVAGTSAKAYCTFIEHVLNTYGAVADPVLHRTLIHDNLSSHKAPEVYEAIWTREHHVVCCPPYCPQDGPVKFAINQVCQGLERH
jgi:hypothetical protein